MPGTITRSTASPIIIATPPCGLPSTPAAAYIGVSRKTLSNWRAIGEGPPYARFGKTGARIVYRVVDLEQFLAEHIVGAVR